MVNNRSAPGQKHGPSFFHQIVPQTLLICVCPVSRTSGLLFGGVLGGTLGRFLVPRGGTIIVHGNDHKCFRSTYLGLATFVHGLFEVGGTLGGGALGRLRAFYNTFGFDRPSSRIPSSRNPSSRNPSSRNPNSRIPNDHMAVSVCLGPWPRSLCLTTQY